ncbi:MAG: queuosine precursor transporter [Holosporales bacterium]|jgi:uncharacterized integral membrane protein (TIGR00697 family)|nr:queuosine precursor transporter [Holosporales bacterium]
MNAEAMALIELLSCLVFVVFMLKYFGTSGLYVYMSIISVVANIQNLRIASFSFIENPMALGSITFSTIFIVTNLMTEYYGQTAAKRGVLLSLVGYALFSILMLTTTNYPASICVPPGVLDMHVELSRVFAPTPYLMVASVLAFVIGQRTNVAVYAIVKRITSTKFIWVRSFASLVISIFIDAVVYAVLAWKILYKLPIGWDTLFKTYILANYVFTVTISLCGSPIVCVAKKFIPASKK